MKFLKTFFLIIASFSLNANAQTVKFITPVDTFTANKHFQNLAYVSTDSTVHFYGTAAGSYSPDFGATRDTVPVNQLISSPISLDGATLRYVDSAPDSAGQPSVNAKASETFIIYTPGVDTVSVDVNIYAPVYFDFDSVADTVHTKFAVSLGDTSVIYVDTVPSSFNEFYSISRHIDTLTDSITITLIVVVGNDTIEKKYSKSRTTGIVDINISSEILSRSYFLLDGRSVPYCEVHGFYIESIMYTDGHTESTKKFILK